MTVVARSFSYAVFLVGFSLAGSRGQSSCCSPSSGSPAPTTLGSASSAPAANIVDGYPSLSTADGYRYGYSVSPGERLNLHLNASSAGRQSVTVTDVSARAVVSLEGAFGPQSPVGDAPWRTGFGYRPSAAVQINDAFPSGIYFLNGQSRVFFVVKDRAKDKKITVVLPTNTMNAYSCKGGRSLYDCNGHEKDVRVSFLRPLATYEQISPFMKWLAEESGVSGDVQYITDLDMDRPEEFSQSALLILAGHLEYVTMAARRNFDAFVRSGKNALVLGGNMMWWNSRYAANGTELIVTRSMEDPGPTADGPTDLFTKLGYGPEMSLGANFDHGGREDNRWDGVAKGMSNPFRVIRPESPVFAGTAMARCAPLDLSMGYEFDGPALLGFDKRGEPVVDGARSGHPHNFEILAYAWGYRYGHTVGTIHAYQPTETSGAVLQFGSIGATFAGLASATAPAYKKILRNSIHLLTGGPYPFREQSLVREAVAVPFATPYASKKPSGFFEACAR